MTFQLSRVVRALAFLAFLSATPFWAAAQETPPAEDGLRPEFEAFSEDARDALERALNRLGPIIQNMIGMIDGVLDYEAPRVLPNGDILIPRKREAPPTTNGDDPPKTLDL
ncbi:MAG: hypothetical protein AAF676_13190 [Pseudomonadota bacterium]